MAHSTSSARLRLLAALCLLTTPLGLARAQMPLPSAHALTEASLNKDGNQVATQTPFGCAEYDHFDADPATPTTAVRGHASCLYGGNAFTSSYYDYATDSYIETTWTPGSFQAGADAWAQSYQGLSLSASVDGYVRSNTAGRGEGSGGFWQVFTLTPTDGYTARVSTSVTYDLQAQDGWATGAGTVGLEAHYLFDDGTAGYGDGQMVWAQWMAANYDLGENTNSGSYTLTLDLPSYLFNANHQVALNVYGFANANLYASCAATPDDTGTLQETDCASDWATSSVNATAPSYELIQTGGGAGGVTSTPEPASLLLLGTGLAGLGGFRRRRKR